MQGEALKQKRRVDFSGVDFVDEHNIILQSSMCERRDVKYPVDLTAQGRPQLPGPREPTRFEGPLRAVEGRLNRTSKFRMGAPAHVPRLCAPLQAILSLIHCEQKRMDRRKHSTYLLDKILAARGGISLGSRQ